MKNIARKKMESILEQQAITTSLPKFMAKSIS
jgi:hypothetical protein